MEAPVYTFGPFRLDQADRRLTRDGRPVEISGRYFDALLLLAAEQGRLVTKDRFMAEVWRGIPVTDEALTQCIRSLRKALGDDAAAPHYIETVPRHGYRLLAPANNGTKPIASAPARPSSWLLAGDAAAAALGGGLAGVLGGLLYLSAGFIEPGLGTASTLLVLVSINLLLGLVAGGAVGLGISWAQKGAGGAWRIVLGGALGGLTIGALAHMIGTDLFELLFGRSPGAITGAREGALLGAAAGQGAVFAARAAPHRPWQRALPGFAGGALAGAAIVLLGGKLMVGSLAELAARFPGSRLGIGLGRESLPIALATVLECALFAGCVVAALALRRRLTAASS